MISKKRGSRSLIRVLPLAVALLVAGAPPSAAATELLLFPGIALSDARFDVGAWCRYLVIDEALGEVESTTVYVAVTGVEDTPDGGAFWIEVESGFYGAPPSEREATRALISNNIKSIAPDDSLCQFVKKIYIKRGTDAAEPADPASIERYSLSNPTSDSNWVALERTNVDTPLGPISCEVKHLVVEDNREIPMGRVSLFKHDSDAFRVYLSDEVPIFRMVRCEIQRVRDSKTVPRLPGIPDKGREVSSTAVQLIGYGTGAKSLISTD